MAERIRKTKTGKYEINYIDPITKKRCWKRIIANSMGDAQSQRTEIVAEIQKIAKNQIKNPQALGNLTKPFEEAGLILLSDMVADGLRKKTISRTRTTLNSLVGFLAEKYPTIKNFNDINANVIQDYKTYIVIKQGRERGWRSELGTLKGLLLRAVKRGFASKELKEILTNFKKPKTIPRDFIPISREQKTKILDYMKTDLPTFGLVTRLLFRVGWRVEETLSIKRENIEWKDDKPSCVTLSSDSRKNKRSFRFPLAGDNDLVDLVVDACVNNKTAWLFPSKRGNKVTANNYRNYLNRVSLKVIGKKINPHDLRHNVVTMAQLERVSIKDIMQVTGHRDEGTILRYYTHPTEEGLRRALAATK